jgi:hypothetical protein
MRKQAAIWIALFFSLNLVSGAGAAGNSDCAAKCSSQPVKIGHRHPAAASVRLVHPNCCASNVTFPCEIAGQRAVPMPDCSLANCRTKIPHAAGAGLISRLNLAGSCISPGTGLRSGVNVVGKTPPLYLQNLSILC